MKKEDFSRIYFKVKSKLGKEIRTTFGYWNLITTIKHPSIQNKADKVKKTLSNPDYIRQSKKDVKVILYYRFFQHLYVCVVTEHSNGEGYIITAYLTNKIKEGVEIWKKK